MLHCHYALLYSSHNFLNIYFGSGVTRSPDLVEGDSTRNAFSVGYYNARGMQLSDTPVSAETISVRPKVPFGVSTKSWSKYTCI